LLTSLVVAALAAPSMALANSIGPEYILRPEAWSAFLAAALLVAAVAGAALFGLRHIARVTAGVQAERSDGHPRRSDEAAS
jgi:hypothetical protein